MLSKYCDKNNDQNIAFYIITVNCSNILLSYIFKLLVKI